MDDQWTLDKKDRYIINRIINKRVTNHPGEGNKTMQNLEQTIVRRVLDLNHMHAVNGLVAHIHQQNVDAGWWTDLETGESLVGKRNVGELIALCHSELSEALEAHRKDLMDDKLPHRKGIEVELADTVIRICDMAGGLGLDLGGAIVEKLEYNRRRADHKPENRRAEGGKKI